jgi:hypothetical protein
MKIDKEINSSGTDGDLDLPSAERNEIPHVDAQITVQQ